MIKTARLVSKPPIIVLIIIYTVCAILITIAAVIEMPKVKDKRPLTGDPKQFYANTSTNVPNLPPTEDLNKYRQVTVGKQMKLLADLPIIKKSKVSTEDPNIYPKTTFRTSTAQKFRQLTSTPKKKKNPAYNKGKIHTKRVPMHLNVPSTHQYFQGITEEISPILPSKNKFERKIPDWNVNKNFGIERPFIAPRTRSGASIRKNPIEFSEDSREELLSKTNKPNIFKKIYQKMKPSKPDLDKTTMLELSSIKGSSTSSISTSGYKTPAEDETQLTELIKTIDESEKKIPKKKPTKIKPPTKILPKKNTNISKLPNNSNSLKVNLFNNQDAADFLMQMSITEDRQFWKEKSHNTWIYRRDYNKDKLHQEINKLVEELSVNDNYTTYEQVKQKIHDYINNYFFKGVFFTDEEQQEWADYRTELRDDMYRKLDLLHQSKTHKHQLEINEMKTKLQLAIEEKLQDINRYKSYLDFPTMQELENNTIEYIRTEINKIPINQSESNLLYVQKYEFVRDIIRNRRLEINSKYVIK